jgi:predicted ribosome quality control (RQC) complex YloA/Tae2 family protein
MALDGVFLSFLAAEIGGILNGSRVDKVHQPEKDEIDIVFRLRSGSAKLLLSSNANSPRVHLTQISKENPMSPPMFCMLLRKHLTGAKFAGVRQPGFERILFVDFDTHNELGDEVRRTIAMEIMGRYSNIILIDENGRILDAVKHVDVTMSRERQVLPGMTYELPPKQDKLSFIDTPPDAIVARIRQGKDCELQKALIGAVQGISPIVCREISQLVCGDATAHVGSLGHDEWVKLSATLEALRDDIAARHGQAVMVLDAKTRKPMDFSFVPITQYGETALTSDFTAFSQLLDAFYTERDLTERVSQRAYDMLNMVASTAARVGRKLANQREELSQSRDRDTLRVLGDLVSANLYKLSKGMTLCNVSNFYEEGEPEITVKLDPLLTPSQNAQKYYKEYRKASVAEKYLKEQIAEGEEELTYLDTVFDELSRAQNESGLAEIREELVGEGYLKNRSKTFGTKKSRGGDPWRFRSDDGFEILVGRNNRQNDKLTLKTAGRNDMWLHTRNIPGAHVIILSNGEQVPDRTLTQAATLAAGHSKAKDSAQVPVDYTLVRYVKKPGGAKPGKVIYDNFKTAYVTPSPELAEKLKVSGN